MDPSFEKQLKKIACQIRMGVIEGTYHAKCGHPGGSLSIAELVAFLYFAKLRIDPKNPQWEDRDRLVLSKGHAAPALYPALALKGYFPWDKIATLRKSDSNLQGHPDMNKVPGIDMSTGSLGQGISAAAGMALSAKVFGKDYRVITVLGDGEIEEGQVWEAAMFATHKKLDNLLVIVDNNNLQIDGTLEEVNSPYPIAEKFEAFGFAVRTIDGHSLAEIEEAVQFAETVKGKPTAIIMKTVKGKGVSFMENEAGWHGMAPNEEHYETAMTELKEAYALLEQ